MQTLLKILQQYSIFLLFLILEGCAMVLLVNRNAYQQHMFMTSANGLSGSIYACEANILEYFNLRTYNDDLNEQNKTLLEHIAELENQLDEAQSRLQQHPWAQKNNPISITSNVPDSIQALVDSLKSTNDTTQIAALLAPYTKDSIIQTEYIPANGNFEFICAKVVNWSTNKQHNFLTINKGSRDSIQVGMGVINPDGVVGIVKSVGNKFATVIPIINSDMEASARILSNDHLGSVVWEGDNYKYATLRDIARHVPLKVGDTLITSGLTSAFPEGLMIGTVVKADLTETDAYYRTRVELAVDFTCIKYVIVIKNLDRVENDSITKMP